MRMEHEQKIRQALEIVTRISEDTTVPRNIRRKALEAKNYLMREGDDPAVRAASARMALEEVSDDPNMPVHARTQLWGVLSILETIR